jgi:hypothetical protein
METLDALLQVSCLGPSECCDVQEFRLVEIVLRVGVHNCVELYDDQESVIAWDMTSLVSLESS